MARDCGSGVRAGRGGTTSWRNRGAGWIALVDLVLVVGVLVVGVGNLLDGELLRGGLGVAQAIVLFLLGWSIVWPRTSAGPDGLTIRTACSVTGRTLPWPRVVRVGTNAPVEWGGRGIAELDDGRVLPLPGVQGPAVVELEEMWDAMATGGSVTTGA